MAKLDDFHVMEPKGICISDRENDIPSKGVENNNLKSSPMSPFKTLGSPVSPFKIAMYRHGNLKDVKTEWLKLRNDGNSFAARDVWSTCDIVKEHAVENDHDVCGVPRRPLEPEFVELWNHYNFKNPWVILRLWEDYHNNKSEDAIVWLNGSGVPERKITWGELNKQASKVVVYLRTKVNVKKGDRLILCYPPGIDFVIAFIACLLGGFIAVPVYPPTPANQTRDGDRFLDIRKNAGVKIILTNRMYSRVARLMFRLWRGGDASDPEVRALGPPTWVPIEDADCIADDVANGFTPETIYPWTCAFLQFTSGSTSQPKGVVVTHGSLFHNCHLCGKSFGMNTALDDPRRVGEDSFDTIPYIEYAQFMMHRHEISMLARGHPARVFSWLPVYHDMGLIGGLMTPLFGGCQLYQMSPVDFIKKPDLWMQCMSDYRCSCCAAPNFAFELAVKRTSDSQVRSMSLGHVAGMICGAEPVRPSTMNKFFTKFSKAGLRDDVIIPAFGLAENTLIVSSRRRSYDRPKVLAFDAEAFRRDGVITAVPYGHNPVGSPRPRTPGSTDAKKYKGLIELDRQNAEWLAIHAKDTDDSVMTLVGCGQAAHQVDLRIIDHKTMKEVDEGSVGEIWFSSSSTARGYYCLLDKTIEDFYASCIFRDGTRSEGKYMRSGDTGFMVGGELFICGRLKDMLVVRGKNYYPQDIEGVLDSIPELRAGCSVAMSTDDPSNEELCIAAELRDNCFEKTWAGQNVLRTIFPLLSPSRMISAELSEGFPTDDEFYASLSNKMVVLIQNQVGIQVSRVFLLKGRSMAKTTSGKVRRHAARTALLNEGRRPAGLLYSTSIARRDEGVAKQAIDEIEMRTEWPNDDKELYLALVEELVNILIDVVPTSSIPRLDTSKKNEAESANCILINDFLNNGVFDLGMDSTTMSEFGERLRCRIDPEFDLFSTELFLSVSSVLSLITYIGNRLRQMKDKFLVPWEQSMAETFKSEVISRVLGILVESRDEIDAGEYQIDPVEDSKNLCDRILVSPAACRPVSHPDNWSRVLITGVTGFLGQWQLKCLLELFPKIEIVCLVRAIDVPDAWSRLRETRNGSYFVKNRSRITLIPGDITKIMFGIDANRYDWLCQKINVVFHTAADINLCSSYNRLRKVNVLATVRMIEFCCAGMLKPLHFASTLGIFPAYFALWKDSYADYVVEEGHRPSPSDMKNIFPPTAMGYPWTKYVCEKILERSYVQGLPVTIMRYPLTCMCYCDGHTQTDNVMIPLTLAAIQEGIIPKNFIMNANTPCDLAARHSVVVAMTGVTIPKVCPPWWRNAMNQISDVVGIKTEDENDVRPDTGALSSMPCLHLCDPHKVTGHKLSIWLSELGVPIDLVEDPLTLIEAAQERGEASAMRDVIHLTRSPVAKYWFGNRASMVGNRELPVSTQCATNFIKLAWQKMPHIEKPDELWPAPRELFKRCFLYMIKHNILTEISASLVGQVLESGEEILQLTSPPCDICLSPSTADRDIEGTQDRDQQFSASIGGPYSVRNEAFAQAQSMAASVSQRAARSGNPTEGSGSDGILHPLSTAGQLILSMWAKYSGALAHDLMATPLIEEANGPPAYDQPPVLLILSTDRLASTALHTLLVEGTLDRTFRSPSLKECLPASVRPSLATELLEVYDAFGILGLGSTGGAELLAKTAGNGISGDDLKKMTEAPSDDTLLLEMLPDTVSVPSMDCLLGLDDISFTDKWNMRYAYHKQFLSRRDIYREGQIMVISSPIHALHLDEFLDVYPNTYVVMVESNSRERWITEARQLSEVVERTKTNLDNYVANWATLHDAIEESMAELKQSPRALKGRHLVLTSKQLTTVPFDCLNRVLTLMRPELHSSVYQLSMVPMMEMIVKYISPRPLFIRNLMRSMLSNQKILMNVVDYLFIGLDRSGVAYYRGNRLVKYGIDAYQGLTDLIERARNITFKF